MQRLLIQACSRKKLASPAQPSPAIDRYDGPPFQVIRKWRLQGRQSVTRILILSAKFGLIDSGDLIPDYDVRMNKQAAQEMRALVARRYVELTKGESYENIFVNLGRDYLPAISEIPELSQAHFAQGGIGARLRQLKTWLNSE